MDETRFQLIKAVAFTGSLGLMFALQTLAPYRRAPRLLTGNWRQNIPLAVMNTLVMSLLCGACLCTTARYAEVHGLGLLRTFQVPAWAAAAGTILVLDFVMWAWHLSNHRWPWLWRFHRVHHSDIDFDVSTSLRFHTGELLLGLPLKLITVAALGAPIAGILLFEVVFGLFNIFVHGNIRMPVAWEKPLSALLIMPSNHRLHHSMSPRNHNRNFGTVLSLWDRGLGTWGGGSSAQAVTTGLPDLIPAGRLPLWRCLVLPFERRPAALPSKEQRP
jgi:sterol desaturase/sphingolipid hydroxylase (fatty acid hydroxylase superfamily)